MRRSLSVLAAAALVVSLGAPAYAGNARDPAEDKQITAMRDRDGRRHHRGDSYRHRRHHRNDDGYRHRRHGGHRDHYRHHRSGHRHHRHYGHYRYGHYYGGYPYYG